MHCTNLVSTLRCGFRGGFAKLGQYLAAFVVGGLGFCVSRPLHEVWATGRCACASTRAESQGRSLPRSVLLRSGKLGAFYLLACPTAK